MCNCFNNNAHPVTYTTVHDKFVVVSDVPDILSASRYQLDGVGSSAGEVDPRAVVQSSVNIGSEWYQISSVHVSVDLWLFLPSSQMNPLKHNAWNSTDINHVKKGNLLCLHLQTFSAKLTPVVVVVTAAVTQQCVWKFEFKQH